MKHPSPLQASFGPPTLLPLNQWGQMTIEMVLMLTLVVGLAVSASRYMKSNQILAGFIGKPWKVVQGMIEDGVWVKQGASKSVHPNGINRHATPEGDKL